MKHQSEHTAVRTATSTKVLTKYPNGHRTGDDYLSGTRVSAHKNEVGAHGARQSPLLTAPDSILLSPKV
ncbi:hypothetical protein POX_a01464 [Penicillium oxalicum]|uniref:Uncharacterized protein n=1 Tax=Penicillium oxalicum (strain 114-2 / CGMCC 5302) TaxID=933388 RepID=S8BEP8_PENO1|nr:hypothetical protein POX_a01464 [Penicillium oxalicum]EPS33542.1 hypothetical protein PDE_08504 [Penicillium oxalicum 114-2]KAI2794863.1 hypothetical protein POX_a01464 [Penicillium oxalicum]